MRRSSGEAQTEPLAALAALFAVGVGLTVFAGAIATPRDPGATDAEAALQAVYARATHDGVLEPEAIDLEGSVPAGWEVNVTLETPAGRRHLGPVPPDGADRADRTVAVALGPGTTRPGHLEVAVW